MAADFVTDCDCEPRRYVHHDLTSLVETDYLKAGFYPTTVSYLSLFYTRYEFARRLGMFYGQYAIAGALGGILSYAVFSRFPHNEDSVTSGWKSWQILFLLEGGVT